MLLTADRLPDFALGCAMLGSGGGGSTRASLELATQAIEDNGPVEVLPASALPEEAPVLTLGPAGSALVTEEAIGGTTAPVRMREQVEHESGAPVVAVLCGEIGGFSGPFAAAWAARLGLPLLDADTMGRAYPRMDQNLFELAGSPATPAVLCDTHGHIVVLRGGDGPWLERFIRGGLDAFGGHVIASDYPANCALVDRHAARESVSHALALGTALRAGTPNTAGIRELAQARVTAIEHIGGRIEAVLEGVRADSGRLLRVLADTEYLAVLEDGATLAVVPDVITLFATRERAPIELNELRYGQRLAVLTTPTDPAWYTAEGLALGGPAAFGIEVPR